MREGKNISRETLFILFFGALIVFLTPLKASGSIQVRAEIDRTEVGLEDEIHLTVIVEGAKTSSDPVLPPMPAFNKIGMGTTSSIQIINGVVSAEKIFRYTLIPRQEGTFRIDPISVFVEGREYTSESIQIVVSNTETLSPGPTGIPSTEGDQPLGPAPPPPSPPQAEPERPYWITTTVSKSSPYIHEGVLFTFKFYTSVNVGNATLELPEFKDFWSEEVVEEKKYYENIGERRFVVNERVLAIYPLRSGSLKVGETILHVDVTEEREDDFFGDSFFSIGRQRKITKHLRSEPHALEVLPLPDGQPDNFTNLVGHFGLGVSLSDSEIKMGDSATLHIDISGKGNVKDAILPKGMHFDSFKVYDDKPVVETTRSPSGIEGKKSFKKALVPLDDGTYTLEPFSISYFNPHTSQYETLESPELSLIVLPSEDESTHSAGIGSSADRGKQGPMIIPEDIATVHTRLSIYPRPYWTKRRIVYFVSLITGPFILFFGTLLLRHARYRRERLSDRYRVQNAYKKFTQGLKALEREVQETDRTAKLLGLVRGYMGDRFLVYGRALTDSEMATLLEARRVSHESIEKMIHTVRKLEAFQYGMGGINQVTKEMCRDLKRTLRAIDSETG